MEVRGKWSHGRGVLLWAGLAASLVWPWAGPRCGWATAGEGSGARVDAETILERIRYLSSAELEGRGTGTEGGDRAARFIAEVFEEAGLEPGGDGESYLQAFEVNVGSRIGENNSMSVLFDDVGLPYRIERDFLPLSFSASTTAAGQAVFVGYGITAPTLGYDDYNGVDVSGKVALAMRHEPRETDEESPFGGTSLTLYSELRYKAMNAREHGAVALVLFTDPLNHDDVEQELLPFDPAAGRTSVGIPCVQITLARAREMLAGTGKLEDLQRRIDEKLKPRAVPLEDLSIELAVDISRDMRTTYNVLGLLPGSDPDLGEEAVVVGAHYDHLGVKEGEMRPGADDNASGTAGLLELARLFGSGWSRPARSVLFAAFGAEELGVIGSTRLAERLADGGDAGGASGAAGGEGSASERALAGLRPVAMLNMDMIGRLRDEELFVGGVGTSPLFGPLLDQKAPAYGLRVRPSVGGYGPSDHSSFYARGVPVLFFFTGPHEDHHRPTDTWEKIDPDGEARVVSLAADVVAALAAYPKEIAFTRAAEDSIGPPGGERYGGYGRAYLGIVPDFAGSGEGVRLTGVKDGSPAQLAGLRAGDTIVEFDGRRVKDLRDLSYMLKEKKPGDVVPVAVLRDGQKTILQAVLGERAGRRR